MLLLDRIRSNRLLLVVAAICFVEPPLLLRAWLGAKGVGWAATRTTFDVPFVKQAALAPA